MCAANRSASGGKITMLRHLMEGTARAEVSLDDLEERRLAKTDPAMFLKLHPAPVLIDEVQYAPELFSYIKIAVDNGAVLSCKKLHTGHSCPATDTGYVKP